MTRRLCSLAIALFLNGALHITTEVAARAGTGASGEATAAALAKFDEGRKAFEAGQFEAALLSFQASYGLLASPNTRLYMARCYRALGQVASAYTAFQLAAREAQDRLTATAEKRYGATRDAANGEAGEIASRVPRLTIAVPAGLPEDFVVKRDGEKVPPQAWGVAIETDPGRVVIEAEGHRIVPFTQEVTLAEGAQERVEVQAVRLPTATIVLHFAALPAGLAVAVDGAAVDIGAADKPREVDVGNHVVTASAPGYVPLRWQKSLADRDRAVVDVALRPDAKALEGGSRGTPSWLFFTVAGASLGMLGVASAVALHANTQQNEQLAQDVYARDPSARDSIRSQATLANVLFVGGGVLGAGAVVLGFTTRWKKEPSVSAWIAPASLGVRGAF